MSIGFGTYGNPANDLVALIHHDLGLPHVLGFESLGDSVINSLALDKRSDDDDRAWSSVDVGLATLLRHKHALCDMAATMIHRSVFRSSRSFHEAIANVFQQALMWWESHPLVSVTDWGPNDPDYLATHTRIYSENAYSGNSPKARYNQWKYANWELTFIAAHNLLCPLWEKTWQVTPPLRVRRQVGKKTRTLFMPRNDQDRVIFMVLSCLLQHIIPWPSNCHFAPGRGVHTAALAHLRRVQSGYRFALALDVVDAFPSTERGRAVEKIAASLRCQNNEAASGGNSKKWMPFADWDDTRWVAYAAFDIPKAFDVDTQKLVKIEDVGLLQGIPTAPVGFNLIMRPLYQAFVQESGKGGAALDGFADNFNLYGHTVKELLDARGEVQNYCRGFGLRLRDESEIVDLHSMNTSFDFLGLTYRLNALNPHIQISNTKIDEIADVVRSMRTFFELATCMRAVVRHYAPYRLLEGESLQRLCVKAQKALAENQWLAEKPRAEALVSNWRVSRACACTKRRCRHTAWK